MSLWDKIKSNIKGVKKIDPERKNELKIEFKQSYENGFYEKAKEKFDEYQPHSTVDDVPLFFNIVDLANKRKRNEDLERRILEKAAKLDKTRNSGELYFKLAGMVFNSDGDFEKEEEFLKKAVDIDPTGENLNILGWRYLAKERNEEAEKVLERAVNIEPDNFKAWVNLGRAYFELDKPNNAYAALNQAVSKSTDLDNILRTASPLLFFSPDNQKNIFRLIEEKYLKSASSNEERSEVYRLLATALFRWGDPEQSISYFEKAISENDNNLQAKYDLFEISTQNYESGSKEHISAKKLHQKIISQARIPDYILGSFFDEEKRINSRGRGNPKRLCFLEGFLEAEARQYQEPKHFEGLVRLNLLKHSLGFEKQKSMSKAHQYYDVFLSKGGKSEEIRNIYTNELCAENRVPFLELEVNHNLGDNFSRLKLAEDYSSLFYSSNFRATDLARKAAEQYDLLTMSNPDFYDKVPQRLRGFVDQMREDRKK